MDRRVKYSAQDQLSILLYPFSILAKSSCRRRLIYWDPKQVGIYANYSTEQCDLILPCRNDGICLNSDDNQNYSCTCVPGFNGSLCGLDERACKPDTCWNNGKIDVFLLPSFHHYPK